MFFLFFVFFGQISVHVKTPKAKKTISVAANAQISAFKTLISAEFDSPVAHLCLIFAGKILKDSETLTQHNIGEGMTVHLVIKTGGGSGPANNATPAPPPVSRASGNKTPCAVYFWLNCDQLGQSWFPHYLPLHDSMIFF